MGSVATAKCLVPGCRTSTSQASMVLHLAVEHMRCTCGWVGISLGHHWSMMERTRPEGRRDCTGGQVVRLEQELA